MLINIFLNFLKYKIHIFSFTRRSGSVDVAKTVPDTITKWAAGAFCTSPVGFGVAPKTDLTAFKPFFVSLALPYSVIREETFTLKATVFNYLPKCIMVSPLNVFTCSWSGFASICSKSISCRLPLVKSLSFNKGEGHAGKLSAVHCSAVQRLHLHSVCLFWREQNVPVDCYTLWTG